MTKENQMVEVLSEELADLFHNNDVGVFAKRITELGETYTGETLAEVLNSTKKKFARKHFIGD